MHADRSRANGKPRCLSDRRGTKVQDQRVAAGQGTRAAISDKAVAKPLRRGVTPSIAARVHLWLGLTVGLVFAVCGLTGSYLAFYQEIERAAISELRASPGVRPESYEAVYRKLTLIAKPRDETGRRGGDWNIELPANGGVITSRLPGKGGQRMVSLDPATLAVVRDARWGSTVSTWLYELHYHLLMGRSGATVMGVVGLGLIAMLVVGTMLWWRSGRSWRSRLAFQSRGTSQRKIYDIHRLSGMGGLALLLIIVLTATAMSLPRQVRPLLTAFSPISRAPEPASTAADGRQRITVDQALASARAAVPDSDIRWIKVPGKADGAYLIRFWQTGEPSRRFPKSSLWLDQYDGHVLAIRHGPRGSASDCILAWLYPLHSGEAFGLFGRSVVALVGLLPAILFITGLLRWRSKSARLKAHRRQPSPFKP